MANEYGTGVYGSYIYGGPAAATVNAVPGAASAAGAAPRLTAGWKVTDNIRSAVAATNLSQAPRPSSYDARQYSVTTSRWFGGGSGNGTYTITRGSTPFSPDETFARKTWTVVASQNGDTGFDVNPNGFAVTPGKTYLFSGYLRPHSATDDKKGLIQLGANGRVYGNLIDLPKDQWTRLTMLYTVPADGSITTVWLAVDVQNYGVQWQPGEYLDCTGIMVAEVSSVIDYFDGSTPDTQANDYVWTGTPFASTSYKLDNTVSRAASYTAPAPVLKTEQKVSVTASPQVVKNLILNPSMRKTDSLITVHTNLHTNPSVEGTDLNMFNGANAATVTREARPDGKGYWLTVNTTANNIQDSGVNLTGSGYQVTGGKKYTLEVDVTADTADTYYLSCQGAGGNPGEVRPYVVLAAGQTARLSVTWVAAATGTLAVYVLRKTGSAAQTFHVDNIMFVQSGKAPAYFDGSTPAAGDFTFAWTGAANASTSIKQAPNVTGYPIGYTNDAHSYAQGYQTKQSTLVLDVVCDERYDQINMPVSAALPEDGKRFTANKNLYIRARWRLAESDDSSRANINFLVNDNASNRTTYPGINTEAPVIGQWYDTVGYIPFPQAGDPDALISGVQIVFVSQSSAAVGVVHHKWEIAHVEYVWEIDPGPDYFDGWNSDTAYYDYSWVVDPDWSQSIRKATPGQFASVAPQIGGQGAVRPAPGRAEFWRGGEVTLYWNGLFAKPAVALFDMVEPTRTVYQKPTTPAYTDLQYRKRFSDGFTRVTRRVEILNADGETLWDDKVGNESRLISGNISVDYTRDERRSLDVELANFDNALVHQPGGFWYDKTIKCYRGIQFYDESGVRDYEVQLGVFMIDRVQAARFPRTVKVTARDYTKKALLSKFGMATNFQATERMVDIVAAIASNAGIHDRIFPSDPVTLGVDYTFDRETTRWEAMKKIATAFNYELFFNASGYLVMRKFLDPTLGAISHEFSTGPSTGNLVDWDLSSDDTRIFNHISVIGADSDTVPVWADAYNNDPLSPTNIDTLGDRTQTIDSPFVTTFNQAQELADSMLKIASLEEYEINFTSLVYPWLECGEIVKILRPDANTDEPNRFLLTTLSVPMGLEPMTGTGRRVLIVS